MEEKLNVVFGVEKDPEDKRDYLLSSKIKQMESAKVLPNLVDWEPEMSIIKNQGSLGSCLAFAVCAVKEWQERKEHFDENNKIKKYDLSEQWLYYQCKKIDCWPNSQGTSFRFAMKVLSKKGIPVEQGWTYDPKHKGSPEIWASGVARWYRCGSYWRIKSLDEFKVALSTGPIAIGIRCFDEIFAPKNGIVSMPKRNKSRGGHAIAAVGFDDEKRLIKFKNSWGSSWGLNGYGYISYDYFNKFCLDAWYFTDTTVKKKKYKETLMVTEKIKPKEEIKMVKKVKLINKMNQLQEIHIIKDGKDATIPVKAKAMVTIKTDELTEDINGRVTKGLLDRL